MTRAARLVASGGTRVSFGPRSYSSWSRMRKIGNRYAARTWSWKAGVPGGSTCGATTKPEPASVAPPTARPKMPIATKRRNASKGYGRVLRP